MPAIFCWLNRSYARYRRPDLRKTPDKRPPVLAPAYYPGSDRIEGAEAVTLASGQQLSGLDIHIGREHSYCIDGSIEADGASRGSLEVMERRDLAEGWSMERVNSKLTPNGTFRLCGLHPGDYDLVGRSERGEPITLRETATIVSRDVTGLKMRTRTPLSIQGTVSWRSAPDRKAATHIARAGPRDRNGGRR